MSNVKYKKSLLECGATLVTEHHPHSRSFSVGYWIDCGSRFESPEFSGITHFLEHLVFKGTKTRTAYEIARALEGCGGDLNAFTSKEHTCFHGLVLKDDWKEAINLLSDLVRNMKFSKRDFKNEKSVIIQEIAMSEDQPDDIIFDYLLEPTFGSHSIGKPILGSIKSIHGLEESDVYEYYHRNYQGSNLVISCAGFLDHSEIERHLNKLFSKSKPQTPSPRYGTQAPEFRKMNVLKDRPTEQTHMLMAFPSTSFKDELRMEAFIVNSVLGGGMTSRLFQSVREDKGLAYSVHSQLHTMSDSGFITIQAACEVEKLKKLIDTVHGELRLLKKKKMTRKEVDFFKGQIKGSILLGAEDIDNRMHSIAINELIFKKPKTVQDIQNMISKISFDSVNEYLETYFDLNLVSTAVVGPKVESKCKWIGRH